MLFNKRDSNTPRPHLLHIFPSFGIGGVPLRMVRIINHFGKRLNHTILALDNEFAAADFVADLDVTLVSGAGRRAVPGAVLENVFALRRFNPDLLLTYNWGAMEWAMAARLSRIRRHVHFEAGFGKEESDRQLRRRVLFRRWALARSLNVVVPSRVLEHLARDVWKISAERITYVPNGVDLGRFSDPRLSAPTGFFTPIAGELVIGTVAPLRPEKNLGRLLRTYAMLGTSAAVRLIIVGEGAERASLQALALELGVGDSVVFAGQQAPEAVLGSFDIFALSSDTEQMPNALLEAMAASRAIVSVDVGDVKAMVCEANREFIVARDDISAFASAIKRLLEDPAKRITLGLQNRERVVARFSQDRMFKAYEQIFGLNELHQYTGGREHAH